MFKFNPMLMYACVRRFGGLCGNLALSSCLRSMLNLCYIWLNWRPACQSFVFSYTVLCCPAWQLVWCHCSKLRFVNFISIKAYYHLVGLLRSGCLTPTRGSYRVKTSRRASVRYRTRRVGRLGSGLCRVGQLGSGIVFSFHIFTLRILLWNACWRS